MVRRKRRSHFRARTPGVAPQMAPRPLDAGSQQMVDAFKKMLKAGHIRNMPMNRAVKRESKATGMYKGITPISRKPIRKPVEVAANG
jgi:hypothetical protein